MSLFNISGLASGLDTNAMVTELMRLERLPVVRYQERQAQLQRVDDAWGAVNTKLSAVRSAVDVLRKPGAFDAFTRTSSSNEGIVTATSTGAATPGSLTFKVSQIAQGHQFAFGEVGRADAPLWSGAPETLSLTQGGTTHTISTTATTTLQDLARQINDLDGAKLSAQVVQTGNGAYRLLVSASETGTENAVTVNGAPSALGGVTELQAAADAVLDLGGGVTATRSTNTVTDLLAGVTLQLEKADNATPVTITTSRDTEAAKTAVKALVDGVNGVLTTLKDLTSYNPDTKAAGVLQGDPTARKLAMDLRSQISGIVSGLTGDYTTPGSIGIALTRDGLVQLDEAKLSKALDAAFDEVADLFAKSASTTSTAISYRASSPQALPGTYAVEITQPAATASITGTAFSPVRAADRTFTVTTHDGTAVAVTVAKNDTVDVAATKINDALAAQGVTTLRADVVGGALRLQETRYGADVGFSVSGSLDWGLDGSFSGADVAGTIGGEAATGKGTTLTGTSGAVSGLVLDITATAPGTIGTVTILTGLGGAVDTVLGWAEGEKTSADPLLATGAIERARNTLTAEIKRYDDQIAAFEVRLASRELTLRKKFAALESALANVQSQSAWMAGMLPASE